MLNHGCSRGHTLNFTNCSDLAPTIIAMYYSPPGLKRSGTDNSGFTPCFLNSHLNNSHRVPYQKILTFLRPSRSEYTGGKSIPPLCLTHQNQKGGSVSHATSFCSPRRFNRFDYSFLNKADALLLETLIRMIGPVSIVNQTPAKAVYEYCVYPD